MAVSGLWLADNQLCHCPNLLQELLENFPNLSKIDLESNELSCDHLRLHFSEREMIERRRSEMNLLRGMTINHGGAKQDTMKDDTMNFSFLETSGALRPCTKEQHQHYHQLITPKAMPCFFCSLQVCYLDQNKLVTLPPELFTCLPNLKWLSAQRNLLTFLPREISKAKDLEGIRVDHNHLKEIQEEICHLEGLLCLSVSHNDIHCLPESLAKLQRLETLMVQGNPKLLTFPESLSRLPRLIEFSAEVPPSLSDPRIQPRTSILLLISLTNQPTNHMALIGLTCRTGSLQHICASFVAKTYTNGVAKLNIPQELRDLLELEGRPCSQCTCSSTKFEREKHSLTAYGTSQAER